MANQDWYYLAGRSLLGLATATKDAPTYVSAHSAPYVVDLPNHWLLKETSYAKGEPIDKAGVNKGPSGSEVDQIVGHSGISIEVLAHRDPAFSPSDQEKNMGQMIFFETGEGGFVFSVNSIAFGGSLVVDKDLQKVLDNALTEAKSRNHRIS